MEDSEIHYAGFHTQQPLMSNTCFLQVLKKQEEAVSAFS